MGCSSCQQNNHVVPTTTTSNCECACGCTDPVCPTPQPCTDITDSKCIIYTDAEIKCGNDPVVTTNGSVSTALNQIVSYFCSNTLILSVADNYADDAEAAANGIAVGKLYHTDGAVKIRIV